jgi:hypothetical protein
MHDIEVYAAAYAGAISAQSQESRHGRVRRDMYVVVGGGRSRQQSCRRTRDLSTRGKYGYPVCDACVRRLKTLTSQ